MAILKVDPSLFDAMVLSHGHYDHFGGMIGFLKATKGKLKRKLPFYVGGEDAFCLRKNPGGNFGALDRKAIMDADLALMMAEGPALVADHAFTTGRIGQVSFEKPLLPTQEIVGIFDGFGCYPGEDAGGEERRANTSRTISTTRSPPSTTSRARAWWCSPRAAIAASSTPITARRRRRPASTRCTP